VNVLNGLNGPCLPDRRASGFFTFPSFRIPCVRMHMTLCALCVIA
jgi:hypothetical protein